MSLRKQIEAQRIALGFFRARPSGARSCKDMHGKSPKGRQAFELQFVSLRPAAGGEGCGARRAANPYSVGKPCVCPPFRFLCHRGFQRFTILMCSDATLRAEISDNLAGDKRLIVLIISVLQQTIAARSYKKTYHLAGIGIVYICRNVLSINMLHCIGIPKPPARLSDI